MTEGKQQLVYREPNVYLEMLCLVEFLVIIEKYRSEKTELTIEVSEVNEEALAIKHN